MAQKQSSSDEFYDDYQPKAAFKQSKKQEEEESDSGEDFEYYDEEDDGEDQPTTSTTQTGSTGAGKSNFDLIDFISKMDIPSQTGS
jgi:hypothetical protein